MHGYLLASRVQVAGATKIDKRGIMKTAYEGLLAEDALVDETAWMNL